LPPLPEQRRIVAELDALSAQTAKLEAVYKNKIAGLDELKKSILEKAFSGELTARKTSAAIPVAVRLMSPTDLEAGIIAIAYEIHEKRGTAATFGHVKAEKIVHMVEARAEIDLGRNPVKDAAGPNDYRNLMKVESRARKAGFFDVRREENRYRLTKLSGFDQLVAKAKETLSDRLSAVESIIGEMAPMDTRQAEIFATVYAAWNNLLLKGENPTDEDIVGEARENWHPDKLKIERNRFFSAINWMRDKEIVPSGRGRSVVEKADHS
jgi:hypothetical protein